MREWPANQRATASVTFDDLSALFVVRVITRVLAGFLGFVLVKCRTCEHHVWIRRNSNRFIDTHVGHDDETMIGLVR